MRQNSSKISIIRPPFGSAINTRSYSSGTYRYGFNGKELEKESFTDAYDFGARIYDGRLGRWLALDPLMRKYNNISPYNFVNNGVINLKDPDGQRIDIAYTEKDKNGNEIDKSVVYNNGKYYQENRKGKLKEIKGKKLDAIKNNETVKNIVKDIESLRNLGGVSKERLEILENSTQVHTIHFSKNNVTIEQNQADMLAQKPTGSDVNYTMKDESQTREKRPSFIALGYELLGHAFQMDQGIVQNEYFKSQGVGKYEGKECPILYSEVAALAFDNQIRTLYNTTVTKDDDKLKMRDSHQNCSVTPKMYE